jgi:enoyl-CoA hydratase/carnithine racemase
MSENEFVHYEVKKKYAEITIDRPPVHALNLTVLKGIYNSLIKADNDPKVSCILLKSTGTRLFSAGLDLKQNLADFGPEAGREFSEVVRNIPEKMLLMKKPIVTQIQGHAIAMGMILFMSSDLRIFADRPKEEMVFRMPEVVEGMLTRAGSSVTPTISFGLDYAKNILFTGDDLGLEDLPPRYATRVFPLEKLESETQKFMEKLSKLKKSTMWVVKTKLNIYNKNYISRCFDLEDEAAITLEGKTFAMDEWDKKLEDLYKRYP